MMGTLGQDSEAAISASSTVFDGESGPWSGTPGCSRPPRVCTGGKIPIIEIQPKKREDFATGKPLSPVRSTFAVFICAITAPYPICVRLRWHTALRRTRPASCNRSIGSLQHQAALRNSKRPHARSASPCDIAEPAPLSLDPEWLEQINILSSERD